MRLKKRPKMKLNLPERFQNALPNFTLILSVMIVLTICCFIFPEYLTTPEIRSKYPIPLFRKMILWTQISVATLAIFSVFALPKKGLSLFALALLIVSQLLDGSQVYLKSEYNSAPIRMGLDWFILDLFIIALFFIPLEGLFPRFRDQKIIREEFYTDFFYFAFGHLAIQLLFLLTQVPADKLLNFLRMHNQQIYLASLPLVVQVLLAMVAADLTQYMIHRTYHRSSLLWKFHTIHHSIKTLDWLSGSRLHLFEIITTRTIVYVVISYLGFSTLAFTAYLFIAAFQTIWIHANIKIGLGWLEYVIVTPRYHHWHHNDRLPTYDKNFSIHFPLIDIVFGTFYLPKRAWPAEYGVENYPTGLIRQFIRPFQEIFAPRN